MALTLKDKANRTLTALRQQLEQSDDQLGKLEQQRQQILQHKEMLQQQIKEWEQALKPVRKKAKEKAE